MMKKYTLLLFLVIIGAIPSLAQTITGKVFMGETNDHNLGTGTNLGGALHVNIVHPNGSIINSKPVNSDGTYNFTGLPTGMASDWRIVLTNSPTNTQGNRLPGLYFARNMVGSISNPVSQTNALDGEIFFRLNGTNPNNLVNQNFWIREQGSFTCENGIAYQVAAPSITDNATLYSYNILTGSRSAVATLNLRVNGLSYSTATQNILWGHEMGSSRLVRIGPGGGTTTFRIPNLPGSTNYIAASEIEPGYILLVSGADARYYVVDVDPSRSSYLELVDPRNGFAVQTSAPYGSPLSVTPWEVQDFAYIPSTGKLWTVTMNGRITSLDPLTGTITTETERLAGLPSSNTSGHGAVFADNTGMLYIFRNETGQFFKVDPAKNTASLLSKSTISGNNDGASCITATICDINITTDVVSELSVCTGASQVLSVRAESTEDETLSYQWQVSTDGGDTWTDVTDGTTSAGTYSGATTSDLSIKPTSTTWNNNLYKVIVSSASELCVLESSPSTLKVQNVPTTAPTLSVEQVCLDASGSETVNLSNYITSTTPAGATLQFFTSNDALVTDPTQAGSGRYYAVYKNGLSCLGPQSAPIIVKDCSLPVLLSEFVVRQESTGTVNIHWSTSTERNSSHFEVQRSVDATNWKTIIKQNAAGDTKNIQVYTAIDNTAQNGVNYYRLKMIDQDGTFEYSTHRSIFIEKAKQSILYPNPVKGTLKIDKSVHAKAITIYNLVGVKVFQRTIQGTDQVEVGNLQMGNYVVELQLVNGKKLTQQLLVEN